MRCKLLLLNHYFEFIQNFRNRHWIETCATLIMKSDSLITAYCHCYLEKVDVKAV